MIKNLLLRLKQVRRLPLFFLVLSLLIPASISTAAPSLEVVVEDPVLIPAYTNCPESYWYPFTNDRGHATFLTLNVLDPLHSSNDGEWHPVIPQAGYYRVEAYIPYHAPITWCTGAGRTIDHDTTDAHYTIHHGSEVSYRTASQYPLGNTWLDLGEYYFDAGSAGYVSLTDLNDETEYSTTVSFSAMRFTYTRATRPNTYLPMVLHAPPDGNTPPDVGLVKAQGFDVCGLPSIATMQAWWNESPYSIYGLYLGGVQLPAQCVTATPAWVSAVHQQGWSFIPTWVGLQAPCSPWSKKMSADPAVSYQQGRQEADSASTKSAMLGLTNNGLGGTIIYYDMEVYGGASLACRQAAASFMNGWVERLGELGNIAGGYGAHNSYVEDWATLAHVPTDVWAASWYADYYDPYATVDNITWLQGLWVNHQRIRQYAGDHHESWGGIGMGIDSDVADGLVAMPPAGGLVKPQIIAPPVVEDSGWLSANQGWVISGQHLYWTSDRGEHWQEISPGPVQLAYFLPAGQAWAVSTLSNDQLVLYFSADQGKRWDSFDLSLPSDGWNPLQVKFTSDADGWLLLQKVTSQAFDLGLLLKTSDAGITWQSYDLPVAGQINFTSGSEGWLVNGDRQQLFHTNDGGITWQTAKLDAYPLVKTPVPAGTTWSGWQDGGLGWAATSDGSCQGTKGTADFTCQVDHRLWQSTDGGKHWELIPLPPASTIKQ